MRGRSQVAVPSTGGRPLAFPLALGVALLALAIWRAACVLAGPDVDTDAYAHHMIARAILADPHDLAVHWVWLPLFHYLQVPLVALGGTMDDVRWANVALAAAAPLVLFAFVRRTARPGEGPTAPMAPDATAFVAALIAGACPIAMQMGTTGQPEPLFALLALGVAITFEQRRYLIAAPLLGAAVVLRYEAWAMFATVGVLLAVDAAWRAWRGLPQEGRPQEGRLWRRGVLLAVPVALVLAWAALRRPVDGQWFGFLGQTHEFASQVVDARGGAGGVVQLARDLLYYPVSVALRVLGPALPLAAFGLVRTWRQQGARFVLVLAAGLGFVSLTWANHSSLGLDRHFVEAVPLYATFAAQGVAAIAERIGGWLSSVGGGGAARVGSRAAAGLLSVAVLGGLFVVLEVWMGFWRGAIEHGWPERAALGAYLRSLPEGAPVFCDDATLEILSGLDRRRFDRHWTDDPHTWDLIDRTAGDRGVAYVATWRRKLSGHEAAGTIVFRSSDAPNDPLAGVAVMRVLPDANRAAR
jgi:hypothetical protein